MKCQFKVLQVTDTWFFCDVFCTQTKVLVSTWGRWFLTLLIMVVRSPPLSSGFWASPTLEGSFRAFSLENVLHSEPTSITRSPEETSQTLDLNKQKNETISGTRFSVSVSLNRVNRSVRPDVDILTFPSQTDWMRKWFELQPLVFTYNQ